MEEGEGEANAPQVQPQAAAAEIQMRPENARQGLAPEAEALARQIDAGLNGIPGDR